MRAVPSPSRVQSTRVDDAETVGVMHTLSTVNKEMSLTGYGAGGSKKRKKGQSWI